MYSKAHGTRSSRGARPLISRVSLSSTQSLSFSLASGSYQKTSSPLQWYVRYAHNRKLLKESEENKRLRKKKEKNEERKLYGEAVTESLITIIKPGGTCLFVTVTEKINFRD